MTEVIRRMVISEQTFDRHDKVDGGLGFQASSLSEQFLLHRLWEHADLEPFLETVAGRARSFTVSSLAGKAGSNCFDRLPALEIVVIFGVGMTRSARTPPPRAGSSSPIYLGTGRSGC